MEVRYITDGLPENYQINECTSKGGTKTYDAFIRINADTLDFVGKPDYQSERAARRAILTHVKRMHH